MIAFLHRVSAWLPGSLRNHASEARIRVLVQFFMFGMVGLVGFVIDTGTVYALRHSVGLYLAGLAAYFTAATGTWFCNRFWTFRHIGRSDPWHVQWRRFLAANFSGFIINRGVYALLVTFVAAAAREPVLAVFAGAMAGLTLNFNLSRKLVFR
ncbi:MAG TPA: GtrA family protein [Acetobacteraceae bacterium]|nr:GtrA family protein [Acetobacteraceae bacterium]